MKCMDSVFVLLDLCFRYVLANAGNGSEGVCHPKQIQSPAGTSKDNLLWSTVTDSGCCINEETGMPAPDRQVG